MINIRNLDKIYNKGKSTELHVINNTSLNLPSKGLVSLLGPSIDPFIFLPSFVTATY